MEVIIEFNAWHPASLQMFEWKDLKLNGLDNSVEHVSEGVFSTDPDDPNRLVLLPYAGTNDYDGKKLFFGDLVTNNASTVYRISPNKMGGFYGVGNDGDKYGAFTLGLHNNTPYLQQHNKIMKIGNIFQNPKMFPKINY